MGRPSRLTPATSKAVLDALSAGNYLEVAAAYAGVGTSTLHRWLAKGSEENAPKAYREFREAVEETRARAEVRSVALVMKAAQGGEVVERRTIHRADGTMEQIEKVAPPDVRAAQWWLERSQPKRWGRRLIEVSGPEGEAIPVEVRTTALDRVAEALARMAERATAGAELGERDDPSGE